MRSASRTAQATVLILTPAPIERQAEAHPTCASRAVRLCRHRGFRRAGSSVSSGRCTGACTGSLAAGSDCGDHAPNGWGTLRLTTTGRRTGRRRSVIIGYFEDGPNLVSLAMNGWGEGEPAGWLNLQTHPGATVDLVDGRRLARGHAATGDERSRLWARWREIDTNLDAYAARRSSETAVVVLEPRPGTSDPPGWLRDS